MNDENNFSFINNENNQTDDINPQPQPVSQDIFSGVPTEPVDNLNTEQPVENLNVGVSPKVNQNVVEPVENNFTEPTPIAPVSPEPVANNYVETQNTYEPVNNTNKKQLNPKFLILVFVLIAVIIGAIFMLKGCSTGYGKKSSKYPNKYNNTMYYKVSDNQIYEIKYFENNELFVAKDSYKKYLDRRIYYPEKYKNVGYFDIDLKFVNEDTLTSECAKAGSCSNAYEDYNDDLVYKDAYKSNTDNGINTKKINGREYKYFNGQIIKKSDVTYYYVVYQTKITDNVYYVVTYYGGEELTEEKLQGFLNIKVNNLKSESDIQNRSNLEWY